MSNEDEVINLNTVDEVELTEDEQNLLNYTNNIVATRTQLILNVYADALAKRYNIIKAKSDKKIAEARSKGKSARIKEYDRGYLDAFKELYTVLLENIAGEYEAQVVDNELTPIPEDFDIFNIEENE